MVTLEHRIYMRAKKRAKFLGREFSIDEADIKIPDRCPILDIELNRYAGSNKTRINSPSLDRKDTTKGYVKGNVFVISWLANKYKSNLTSKDISRLHDYIST